MHQPCNARNRDGTLCRNPAGSCPYPGHRNSRSKAPLYAVLAVVAALGILGAIAGILASGPAIREALGRSPASSAQHRAQASSATTAANRIAPPRTTTATVTVTRTAASPRAGQSQSNWQGAWLRGYAQGSDDCSQVAHFSVVQPMDADDTYMLRDGCLPRSVADDIDERCARLFHGSVDGYCAVWDPDFILSTPNRPGDLQVVALTPACLDRAHLPAYVPQRPVHTECVVFPRS